MSTKIYADIEDALTDIAQRSFYEDATVTPLISRDGERTAYMVEDESGNVIGDDWVWTYAEGILDGDSVSEISRLHASYESYDRAEHIRYNLPSAVEALEEGVPVTFAYIVVNDASVSYDADGNALDADGNPADDIAGWALAAIAWD